MTAHRGMLSLLLVISAVGGGSMVSLLAAAADGAVCTADDRREECSNAAVVAEAEATVVGDSSTVRNCERNGLHEDYPWRFEGRFIVRPSLIRTSESLFGYSLGGSTVLEYDVSPAGPYTEYVTLDGAVSLGKVDAGSITLGKVNIGRGILGWLLGSMDLMGAVYVSTQEGVDATRTAWGCPAGVADIDVVETGDVLSDHGVQNNGLNGEGQKKKFMLSGWNNARMVSHHGGAPTTERYGNISVDWTPGLRPRTRQNIRVSAASFRLKRCKRIRSEGEIPLGWALVIDDALIEIGKPSNMS